MMTTTVEQVLEVAQATLLAGDYCFLITLGEPGKVNARLMQHFKPEQDLIVWFGASPKSRKVREIRANNHITVACVNTQETGYVTLVGSAQLEDSSDLRRKYWREDWRAFFPEGPTGNDYILNSDQVPSESCRGDELCPPDNARSVWPAACCW